MRHNCRDRGRRRFETREGLLLTNRQAESARERELVRIDANRRAHTKLKSGNAEPYPRKETEEKEPPGEIMEDTCDHGLPGRSLGVKPPTD